MKKDRIFVNDVIVEDVSIYLRGYGHLNDDLDENKSQVIIDIGYSEDCKEQPHLHFENTLGSDFLYIDEPWYLTDPNDTIHVYIGNLPFVQVIWRNGLHGPIVTEFGINLCDVIGYRTNVDKTLSQQLNEESASSNVG